MSTVSSKIIKVLKNTSGFFEETKEEKLRYAIKYLLLISIIPAICAGIITFVASSSMMTSILDGFSAKLVVLFISIFTVVYVYAIYIIMTLISCICLHFFAWIFRCKGGLNATARVTIYANTPTYLLGGLMFIPHVGYFLILLPGLFSLYLTIIGISKQHGVSMKRAIQVVMLPTVILLVFTIYYLLQFPNIIH